MPELSSVGLGYFALEKLDVAKIIAKGGQQ